MPLRPTVTACLLAGITLLLYGVRLQTPLTGTEAAIIQQARSSGSPLFFHLSDEHWLMPVPVYATAAAAAVGATDTPVRVAGVVVAALAVALMFLYGRAIFRGDAAALVAAVLLMFTPAHLALARGGDGAIYQLPAALVSLWCVSNYLAGGRRLLLIGAALAMGSGVYTHPTAPLTMTALAIGVAAYLLYRGRTRGDIGAMAMTFVACFIPAAIWFAAYPDSYADTFGRWVILKAHIRYPLDGVRAFVNWNTLGTRVSSYWGFFDPAWLFFDDGSTTSPMLLFCLPALAWGIVKGPARWPDSHALVIIGALVAPLAGSSFGQPHAIGNVAVLLPFAALLAASGVAAAARGSFPERAGTTFVAVGVLAEFSRHYFAAIG